ncbi:hypothetical protein [Empedobacter brevis]|uniref:hypothetical protein n=1 Tax=Empedobacter brevis TaxID=247 RepID=UPI0028D8FE79|nr:hypothetical protein [Empedobacter brevis]
MKNIISKIQHSIFWNQQKLIVKNLSGENDFNSNWLNFKAIWKFNINRHNVPLKVIAKRFNTQLILTPNNPDFLMSFLFKYETDYQNQSNKIAECNTAIVKFNEDLEVAKILKNSLQIAN